MQRIIKRRNLPKNVVSVFPVSHKFYFPEKAVESYRLRNFQSVRLYQEKDLLFFQFFENGDGDFRLYNRSSGMEISCNPVFRLMHLENGHYWTHRDKHGFLRVNTTRALTDHEINVGD
jgi:hypothetical protein